MQRREAIKSIAQYMGLAAVGGLIWSAYAKETKASLALYPPGARENFAQSCIRCGMCVQACPYYTLRLSGSKINDQAPYGLPIFTPREIPCFMCEDIPCAVICPTDALDLSLLARPNTQLPRKIKNSQEAIKFLDIAQAKMGVAVIDTKGCIAYAGIQCDACYRACPLIDKAIYIDYRPNTRTGKHALLLPMINNDLCTGCGKCERACVTEIASVRIQRRESVLGKMGTNYIKGWDREDENRLKDAKIPQGAKKENKQQTLDYLNSEDF